ncbi:hypothetical protein PITC_053520 [Penicillium italicum]|uniref:Uncharacterized protein n=1 Tax=Penicillium italicum TaxID=40296 RepID=A0A0A2KJW8_PENIT|nr:hypothetical protein PITC_053520 [Penicillium italicum]
MYNNAAYFQGLTYVPSLGASASKDITEPGMIDCNASSGYTRTHASSDTQWLSEPATSAKFIMAECREGK